MNLTLDPSTILSIAASAGTLLLAVIALLLGGLIWFIRREITLNDTAHRELRADIQKLLTGDVVWIKTLLGRQS
ncbi:MAG: hypothetical protein F4057_10035 [Acidobacteria bacterium]|nr:hypothetical protein [Acidobacteriota bacterium]